MFFFLKKDIFEGDVLSCVFLVVKGEVANDG